MQSDSALIIPSEKPESPLSDIHDIRPLVEVSSIWNWLGWLLLLIFLVTLIYLAFLYWKKKHKSPSPQKRAEPPHERARRSLEEALEYLHHPEHFCVLVSAAIRIYLEARFDLHAPERTTEEFLEEIKDSSALMIEQKDALAIFLTECDLVKFARSEPEAYELKRLYESALKLVKETEPSLMEIDRDDQTDQNDHNDHNDFASQKTSEMQTQNGS